MTAPAPDDVVEEFLDWLRLERGRASNTVAAYRGDLGRWTGFLAERGRGPLDASPSDVVEHLAALTSAGRGPRTVSRALVVIRSLSRYAVVEGHAAADPTAAVDAARLPPGLPKALSEAQVGMLIDSVVGDEAVDRRDRAILELLYGTGMRISELCGLRLGDVDLDGRLARVLGKGSKERIVPLGRGATRRLEEWFDPGGRPRMSPSTWRRRDDIDAVFINQRGGRLSRQGAWFVLDRRARVVGLSDVISPHVLRHSCATHMLDRGADIRTVQELLGHASLTTTQIYTKVAVDRLVREYDRCHPRARRAVPTA